MKKIEVYSHKIRDRKSKAVYHLDNYFICRFIEGRWFIVEGAFTLEQAQKACHVLADHDFVNGHIRSLVDYQVFRKEECVVRDSIKEREGDS